MPSGPRPSPGYAEVYMGYEGQPFDIEGVSPSFVEALYRSYVANPGSVEPSSVINMLKKIDGSMSRLLAKMIGMTPD